MRNERFFHCLPPETWENEKTSMLAKRSVKNGIVKIEA
jgi:hypothetical protein